MKIKVSSICANPHRDLIRNPVSEDQIVKLVDSINRTGFWDNLVIRQHPEDATRYQLAYGHNRIEACRRAGIEEVDLPIRDLADYDMLCCMIDENNTQQSITPKIIFENVTAAITLAEKFLNETSNVDEFNLLVKNSHRPDQDVVKKTTDWRCNDYERAKIAISADGDGLGKDFVSHFMPEKSIPSNDTLQSVIDSYYADRRKKAADKREAESREAARLAKIERDRLDAEAQEKRQAELQAQRERDESARKQQEAKDEAERARREQDEQARLAALEEEKLHRKAKQDADARAKKAADEKAQLDKAAAKKEKESADHSVKADREKVKSERMDFAGVDRDLLEKLDSTTKMNDVVRLIKQNKIPKEFHAELIEASLGWSPDGTSSQKAGTSVSIQGASWWDIRSGAQAKRFEEMRNRSREETMRSKFGEYPFETTLFNFVDRLKEGNSGPFSDLKRCAEYFDALNNERLQRLQKILLSIKQNHNEAMDELLGKINDLLIPHEKDITPTTKALSYQHGDE